MYKVLLQADVGCKMENVIEVSQRPELRDGLLDSVDPHCGKPYIYINCLMF